jgi:hypothetical protein
LAVKKAKTSDCDRCSAKLLQYRRAQRWKRAEWVAQEMKSLFADPLVQAALLLIDWHEFDVRRLFPGKGYEKDRDPLLRKDEIQNALRTQNDVAEGLPHEKRGLLCFGPLEAEIRAAFDRLFDGIERFDAYYTTALVKESDLRPYLGYWARKICDEAAKEGSRAYQLRVYMNAYEFKGALRLLARLAKATRFHRPPRLLDARSIADFKASL